eukprot:1719659-Rhodomonas_salina.2
MVGDCDPLPSDSFFLPWPLFVLPRNTVAWRRSCLVAVVVRAGVLVAAAALLAEVLGRGALVDAEALGGRKGKLCLRKRCRKGGRLTEEVRKEMTE